MTDPDTAPGALVAVAMLSALPERTDLPAQGIEINLPPSWFSGMSDAVTESPLFARYIPEVRLRLPWTLPGVAARDDERLDPDGYRILILGGNAEEGTISLDAEYVPRDAVPLLSPAQQERLTEHDLGGMIMLRPAEQPASGLDALLIVPAAEMVARRIQAMAEIFQLALKQFWSHQSGQLAAPAPPPTPAS